MSRMPWKARDEQKKRIRGALVAGESMEAIVQREGCSMAVVKAEAKRPHILQAVARNRVGTAVKCLENAESANRLIGLGLNRLHDDFQKDKKVRLEAKEMRDLAYVSQYCAETAGELLKQAGISDDQLDADGELTKALRREIKKQMKKVRDSGTINITPNEGAVDVQDQEEEEIDVDPDAPDDATLAQFDGFDGTPRTTKAGAMPQPRT